MRLAGATFDSPAVQRELYGDQFETTKTGRGQIFVLGQYNSGTSITTRLIMLLGGFQGSKKYVAISQRNKLKTYESLMSVRLNSRIIQQIGDPHFQAQHAQGLDFNRLKDSTLTEFKVMKDSTLTEFKVLSYFPMSGIVVGGRVFDIACVPPNM